MFKKKSKIKSADCFSLKYSPELVFSSKREYHNFLNDLELTSKLILEIDHLETLEKKISYRIWVMFKFTLKWEEEIAMMLKKIKDKEIDENDCL